MQQRQPVHAFLIYLCFCTECTPIFPIAGFSSHSLTHETNRSTVQPKDPIHHVHHALRHHLLLLYHLRRSRCNYTCSCVSSVQSNLIVVDRSTKQAAIIVSTPHTHTHYRVVQSVFLFYFIFFWRSMDALCGPNTCSMFW